MQVYATARTEAKQAKALELGAHESFASGARLPERVDAVMETIGEATWSHSLKSLKPGGKLVVCGATSGPNPPADLNRVFFLQLQVLGSTMGTKAELAELISFLHVDRPAPADRPHDPARVGGRRARGDRVRRPGRKDRPRALMPALEAIVADRGRVRSVRR